MLPSPDESFSPRVETLSKSISMCITNGQALLADAKLLFDWERFSTALALGVLAQEEFAKAFVLQLVADNALPWLPEVRRSINSHECKHLLAVVMDWLPTFDWADDEWNKRRQEYQERWDELKAAYDRGEITAAAFLEEINRWKESFQFPETVRAALNIYRHEEIEKLGSRDPWKDDEWAKGEARKIAKGALDAKKQSALYVSIGKTGAVGLHPGLIKKEDALHEIERARALSELRDRTSNEYRMLTETLPRVFADLQE